MKNFLIALGLLTIIVFIKNLYKDNQFLTEEVEILNYELLEKDSIIKNRDDRYKILSNKIRTLTQKPKKKIKKIIKKNPTDTIKPIQEKIIVPEIIDTIK